MDKTQEQQSTVLAAASDYFCRGWSIIPVRSGTKRFPMVKWTRYQTQRPSKSQIQNWFSDGTANIAVVLGEVSGGLSCRDYDGQAGIAEYILWAKNHPDLTKQLPIVQTADGFHVYFAGHVEGCLDIKDANGQHLGELRGSKHYCMLPPSVHPDGPVYQWINCPNGSIPAIDPKLSGLLPDVTQRTQENTKEVKGGRGLCSLCNSYIEQAIRDTLPTVYGARHRKIFEFARHLKSMPQYFDADPVQLREVVKEWHKRALPKIRTKEFEETWIDFISGWKKIKHLVGHGPMAKIFDRAKQAESPKIALEVFPGYQTLQLFTSLCRELQKEAGDEPFYIDCRTGARYMQVSAITISRWFMLLCHERIVKLVKKGGFVKVKGPDGKVRKKRLASTYKYLYEL